MWLTRRRPPKCRLRPADCKSQHQRCNVYAAAHFICIRLPPQHAMSLLTCGKCVNGVFEILFAIEFRIPTACAQSSCCRPFQVKPVS